MKKIFKWLNENKTYVYAVGISVVAFMFMLNALFTIQLKWENADLNEKNFELENRLKSVQQEKQRLETDIYIEQQASERLGMVKSTEIPVKVIEYEENTDKQEVKAKQEKTYIYLTEWYKGLGEIFLKEEPVVEKKTTEQDIKAEATPKKDSN